MYDGLAVTLMIASLVVGAWCFVAAARDRWTGVTHLVGLGALELGLVVQAVAAFIRIGRGERPEEFLTFVGYLLTSLLMLPAVVTLSFMERTRWGAVIAGAGAVVVAVLVLRLQQVWTL